MITNAAQDVYDRAQSEFVDLFDNFFADLSHWFGRLSDIERLVGLCAFILVLFLLVLVKATTRESRPGKARSFVGSFTLVVTFSFLVGMILDTPYDPRQWLPAVLS